MKISQKLILLFLISALIPIVGIGVQASYSSSNALTRQITGQLNSVAQRQANRVQQINNNNLEVLGVFIVKLQLKLLLQQYETQPSDYLKTQMQSIQMDYMNSNSLLDNVSIVDTSGHTIISTDPGLASHDFSKDEEFAKAKVGSNISVFGKGLSDQPQVYLSGPLTLQGKLLGYAILGAETNNYLSVVQDYDELGSTGETYFERPLPDKTMQNLLSLRFDPKAALSTVDSESASAINKPGNKAILSFKDYRGHDVLGIAKNIPNTDWKIVVKIDKNEVLAPVYKFRQFTYIVLAITVVITIVLALWFSRIITTPIKKFTDVVQKIQAGDLSLRAKTDKKDEIGTLAVAFNEMTNDFVESQAHLMASVTSLSQGFIMVDQNGIVGLVNKAATQLLEFDGAVINQKPHLTTIMQSLEGFDTQGSLDSCMKQQKYLDIANVKHAGSDLRIYFSPTVVNGQTTGAVVLVVDETKERIIQRSRDEFFSIASHELRTPLTSIRGNSDMMKDFFSAQVKDPMFDEMVDDIHASTVRLIEIVNDFLDVSSLEQDKIKFASEAFDLSSILESVVKESAVVANGKHTHLEVEKSLKTLPAVYGDKNRVKQIVYNLVGNSLKFTENGTITLKTTQEGPLLKIRITDTGTGISDEGKKLLFHKFQQAGDSLLTRNTGHGTGLGLYISKMLVEKMGGQITLEQTEVDKGTTFWFTIPIASAEQISSTAKAVTAPQPAADPAVTA